jgi:LCP family protein required for cell wall assembly
VFEHLDDPRPPAFGAGFRHAVVDRARRRRRHRRMAGGAGVAVASLIVGVGGLYGRVLWRAHDIERVDVAGTASVGTGEPVTVLVVGTDARGSLASGGRTDTMLLARLDPEAGTGALLSLPRDLMVEPPGGGAPVLLSALAADYGLDGLVTVVETQVGVPVDHVVQVDFDGFRSLVDRIGGIDVWVDTAVRDDRSGLYLDQLGCVTLDGEQALALARSRKIEVMDASGTWVRDPWSDLRRVETQRVMVAALAGLVDEGADPISLTQHVEWAVANLTLDSGLGVEELVRLAEAAAALEPASVAMQTLPVVPYPGDVNRLAADPDRAPAAVDAFVTGQPVPAAPPTDPAAAGPEAGDGLVPPPLPGGAVVDTC